MDEKYFQTLDVNYVDEEGNTLLAIVSSLGFYELTKKVYKQNRNKIKKLNNNGENILITVAKKLENNYKSFDYLIRHGADVNFLDSRNWSAFTWCAKLNRPEHALILLQHGLHVYNIRTSENILPANMITNRKKMSKVIDLILSSPKKKKPKKEKLELIPENEDYVFTENFKMYDISELEIVDNYLNEGSYGLTKIAKLKANGKKVALKTYKHCEESMIDFDTIKEITYLRTINKISDKAAVKLYGICIINSCVFLILELLTYTIQDVLNLYRELDKTEFFKDIFYLLLKHLSEIHSVGIVHSDIKPMNIMIDSDNYPRYIDFGISEFLGISPPKELVKCYDCTATTKAPDTKADENINIEGEIINMSYGLKNYTTDVFSLCQVFMESLFPQTEFRTYIYIPKKGIFYTHCENPSVYFKISLIIKNELKKYNIYDLICKMCHYNSSYRIDAKDAMNDSYFGQKTGLRSPKIEDTIIFAEKVLIPKYIKFFENTSHPIFTEYRYPLKYVTENLGLMSYSKELINNYYACTFKEYLSISSDINLFQQSIKKFVHSILSETYNKHDLFLDVDILLNIISNLKLIISLHDEYYRNMHVEICYFLYYFYLSIYNYFKYEIRNENIELYLRLIKNNLNIFSINPVKSIIQFECNKLYEFGYTEEDVANLVEFVKRKLTIWYLSCHVEEYTILNLVQVIISKYVNLEESIENKEIILQLMENETDIFGMNDLNVNRYNLNKEPLSFEELFMKKTTYKEFDKLYRVKKTLNNKCKLYFEDSYFEQILNLNFNLEETIFMLELPHEFQRLRNYLIMKYKNPIIVLFFKKIEKYSDYKYELLNLFYENRHSIIPIIPSFVKDVIISSQDDVEKIETIMEFFNKERNGDNTELNFKLLYNLLSHEKVKLLIKCYDIFAYYPTLIEQLYVFIELDSSNIYLVSIIIQLLSHNRDEYKIWYEILKNNNMIAFRTSKVLSIPGYIMQPLDKRIQIFNSFEESNSDVEEHLSNLFIELHESDKNIHDYFRNFRI